MSQVPGSVAAWGAGPLLGGTMMSGVPFGGATTVSLVSVTISGWAVGRTELVVSVTRE